jgi:SPP1 family predicted phage head-tail adaptor
MESGKLNKRIKISKLVSGSPVRDSLGTPNTSWEEVATVWGAIRPLSGRDFFAQQQIQSEISVEIKIRYRDDISSGMKAEYYGKTYMIKTIIDTREEHRELLLMCSEGVINA